MYGTRDAGALWEATYTKVLVDMGFTQGVASPCCYYHREWGVSLVVHGDDFTALGTEEALSKYERGMCAAFDVELRGRLGMGPKDLKEIKVLNRVLRVNASGLFYEADVRHVELLAKALGLEKCSNQFTPGAKQYSDEVIADGKLQHEDEARAEMIEYVNALVSKIPRQVVVKFSDDVVVHEIPTYAETFGCSPRRFVVDGPIGSPVLKRLPTGSDPFTGLPRKDAAEAAAQWKPDVHEREERLRHVLNHGPAWEVPTDQIIASLSQRAKPKRFVKKRVGCRQAKRLEALGNCSEVLGPAERTMFRALAARAHLPPFRQAGHDVLKQGTLQRVSITNK